MTNLFYSRSSNQERIRGPTIARLVKSDPGAPFVEGIAKADEKKRIICSNTRLTYALFEGEDHRAKDAFPCWTGTIAAYDMPGKKLGKKIESVDSLTKERWVFPVSEEFRGEENCVLVAEHPNYIIEVDGRNRVVQPMDISIVRGFPISNGCYAEDQKYGIPIDQKAEPEWDGRYLWRIGKRVGPIARGFGYVKFGPFAIRRNVHLDKDPSRQLGIIVEAVENERNFELV